MTRRAPPRSVWTSAPRPECRGPSTGGGSRGTCLHSGLLTRRKGNRIFRGCQTPSSTIRCWSATSPRSWIARLAGPRLRRGPALCAATARAFLPLDGGEALRLDLHPTRGWIALVAPRGRAGGAGGARRRGWRRRPTSGSWWCGCAPRDRFRAPASARLVVELHTNQWNALLVTPRSERIALRAVVAPRGRARRCGRARTYRAAGGRPALRRRRSDGGEARAGWHGAMRRGRSPRRAGRALLERLRLHRHPQRRAGSWARRGRGGADADALDAAFERWWALRASRRSGRVLLAALAARTLPYPLPLPGLAGEPVARCWRGWRASAADGEGGAPAAERTERAAAAPVRARRQAAGAPRRAPGEELARAGEADAAARTGATSFWRACTRCRAGRRRSRLQRLGRRGRWRSRWTRRSRPRRTRSAGTRRRGGGSGRTRGCRSCWRRRARSWSAGGRGRRRRRRGQALAPEVRARAGARGRRAGGDEETRLPYRRYRTSGGLEVRVGRSAKRQRPPHLRPLRPERRLAPRALRARLARHPALERRGGRAAGARPGARPRRWRRSSAGAHARRSSPWTGRAASTSASRAARPPGAVIPQQVQTLFVEPTRAVEERLQAD